MNNKQAFQQGFIDKCAQAGVDPGIYDFRTGDSDRRRIVLRMLHALIGTGAGVGVGALAGYKGGEPGWGALAGGATGGVLGLMSGQQHQYTRDRSKGLINPVTGMRYGPEDEVEATIAPGIKGRFNNIGQVSTVRDNLGIRY